MRRIQISQECLDYIDKTEKGVMKKFKYCLQVLTDQKVIHTKLVKKLVNTEFYELRISTGNEHRIIILTVDHENIIEANRVVLLNGFQKKSSKEYKAAIEIARKLLEKYKLTDHE